MSKSLFRPGAEGPRHRKPVEQKIKTINKKLGKRIGCIVPVGDAFVKMRAMVVAGKFPGVTKQSELFNDDMPHQGRLGSLLTYGRVLSDGGKIKDRTKLRVGPCVSPDYSPDNEKGTCRRRAAG